MAKYYIEIDENDEDSYPRQDIDMFVNRHKIINALNELANLRRQIYKGYLNKGVIIVKDINGAKEYYSTDDLIDKVNDILGDVIQFLD